MCHLAWHCSLLSGLLTPWTRVCPATAGTARVCGTAAGAAVPSAVTARAAADVAAARPSPVRAMCMDPPGFGVSRSDRDVIARGLRASHPMGHAHIKVIERTIPNPLPATDRRVAVP